MHPMKRPRRPAKRVASKKTKVTKRKKNKIITGLKQALRHAREVPDWAPEDAAVFDIPKPPPGFAYQWAPFSRIEYMRRKGWVQVPYSRHPEMPLSTSFDGYILYRDTTLFQISEELVRGELDRAKLNAKDLEKDFYEVLGIEGAGYKRDGFRTIFHILSPHFMVSSNYEGPPDTGPVVVDLTIKFTMPWRWRDAAAALQISESEYVRRRLIMSSHLLHPDDDGTYSVVEEVTTKKVEI
jgi:hypothetical protein